MSRRFDHVLDSADEGVEKPDPRFFEIALRRSGAAKETTIHVGDLYDIDVVGARSAGLRAVLLDEADLRPDADCPRVRTLGALVEQISGVLVSRLGPAFDLRPRILERDGPVEHRARRRRVGIDAEIADALELKARAGCCCRSRGLDLRVRNDFERGRVELRR